MSKKTLFLLVIVSFLLQLFLSFLETYGDTGTFFVPWAQSIEKLGFGGFYERILSKGASSNYPPIAIYVLTGSFFLASLSIKPFLAWLWNVNIALPFFPSSIVTFFNKDNLLLYTFMKIPNIIANIFLAVGIYFLVRALLPKDSKSKLPSIALITTLFNPALIFLSALWGQIDVIPLTLTVWSFYFLFIKSHRLSILFLALALLTKQTVALAIPFYGLYFLKDLSWKKTADSAAIIYLAFVAAFLPFQKTLADMVFPFMSYLKIASGFGSDILSMHAHNFWMMAGQYQAKDTQILFSTFSFRSISQLVVGIFFIFIISKLWRHRKNLPQIISALAIFSLLSFMFLTRMHERHLVVALPFILLASITDFRFLWLFVFESLYLLINMYAAWPIPKMEFLSIAVNSRPVVNVLVVMQITVMTYFFFHWLGSIHQKNK